MQAAAPESPAAFGLYRLDETELTVSEIVAPALTTAAWADGATPVGSLVSDSTAQPLNLQPAGDGRYIYTRDDERRRTDAVPGAASDRHG